MRNEKEALKKIRKIQKEQIKKILRQLKAEREFAKENRKVLIGLKGNLHLINKTLCPVIIENIDEEGAIKYRALCEITFKDTDETVKNYIFNGYGINDFKGNPEITVIPQ